jgi:tetratricopeptide (TPR) repeat protein
VAIDLSAGVELSADAAFRAALALHQQSRLNEARLLYEQVLETEPRHLQALTFLSAIALQLQLPARVLELTGRALELEPQAAAAATHLIRGHAQVQQASFEAALASYERATDLKPDFADAYFHRGNVLSQLGMHQAAVESYDKALAYKPNAAETYNNRGNALCALKNIDAAIASYDSAIATTPGFAEPYFNRGLALYDLKRYEAALASYEHAIAIHPGYAEAYCSRGNALKELGRLDAALASYDQAIAVRAGYAQAYSNRGNLLSELQRFDAALASYDAAVAIEPDNADAHCNRGNLLADLRQFDQALQSFGRAIAIDADYAQAYFSRSFVYLVQGDFERGWRDFEWRWQNEHCATSKERRRFAQPLWLGDQSLEGKSIFLHSEQGLGDTIQFCRYVKRVADLGAKVILEIPIALANLLMTLPGLDQLVLRGETPPPFDYYCPLMSLPLALKTTLATIPAEVPYLHPSAQRVQYWKDKLGERAKPRVGVVWSGGFRPNQPELWAVNRRRNIPLAALAPLRHPGIEFYSLQKGQPAESELSALMAENWDGPSLKDYTGELQDFEDTAALIEQLDLIISVDTSAVHLAGALGKPVWLLNRFDTCWRWQLDRSDSPWYPTVRVYRQQRPGDWDGVVQRMRRDLEQFFDGATD